MTDITPHAARALRTAIRDTRLSAADLRVYEALIDHARGDTCRPSRERLAVAGAVHVVNVSKHTARLVECGYLVIRRTRGRLTNVYRLPHLADMGITSARVDGPPNRSDSAPVGEPPNPSETATVEGGPNGSNPSESARVGVANSLGLADDDMGSESARVGVSHMGSEFATPSLGTRSDAPAFADADAAGAASPHGSEDGSAEGLTADDLQHLDQLNAELEAFGQEKPKGRSKGKKLTFAQWEAQCVEAGRKMIEPSDPVFVYARTIELPQEFLDLGWQMFRDRHEHGRGAQKRQADWPATFRNYVKNPSWLGVWYLDARLGEYVLTTAGQQLLRELAADQGKPVPGRSDDSAAGRAERLGNEAIQRLTAPSATVVARIQQMLEMSDPPRARHRRPNNITMDFEHIDYSPLAAKGES